MPTNWATIGATVVVGLLVFGAVYYTYSQTSSQMSSLSSQNAKLSAENADLQNGISSLQVNFQQQVSSLGQQVSVLEQRTVQVVTNYETIVSVMPTLTTETQTDYITSTSTVYPIPDNVTVFLVASSMFMNYAINAGTYSLSGSLGNSQSFNVSPVYQGETITIDIGAGCGGSTGPTGSASLYLNGALVAHSGIACGGNNSGLISYTL